MSPIRFMVPADRHAMPECSWYVLNREGGNGCGIQMQDTNQRPDDLRTQV